eukprot:scaffold7011_cov112-Isochrysis_galbana.AAC.28
MANRFRGTLGEFLASEPTIHSENTLIVGFNTGMGSGLWPLMRSWLTDLLAILRGGFIALFTCANDFSDLRGETLVWELLHARFLISPQRNPFKAATIVHEPRADASADPEWSCSSCFLYAVCGRDEGAPPLPAPGGEGQLERKMLKLANHLVARAGWWLGRAELLWGPQQSELGCRTEAGIARGDANEEYAWSLSTRYRETVAQAIGVRSSRFSVPVPPCARRTRR